MTSPQKGFLVFKPSRFEDTSKKEEESLAEEGT